ncbi:MAG TPA: hypothetical protein VIR57_08005 [Chloroflexota bacterium]|jgi:hypothetical protein
MIKVYGASDDLVEVEGDIREEFTPRDDNPSILAFSDGTVLDIQYGSEGIWRINRLATGSVYSHVQAPPDDDDNYSDVVTLDGEITWVLFANDWRLVKA